MAKTLLQYSCLYILPFLFGMCLCGLEQEQFLMVVKTEQGRRVGIGRILLARPPQDWTTESVWKSTQVILQPKEGLTDGPGPSGQTDKVSVYMEKAINGMNEDAVGVLLKEAANDPDNWTDFQIHGEPIEEKGNIQWTISVLPGGTTYPNTWFSTPVSRMLGYVVDRNIRFLGGDIQTIQKLQRNISIPSARVEMAVLYENADNDFFQVTVIPDSLKVSGGGYILDLMLSS